MYNFFIVIRYYNLLRYLRYVESKYFNYKKNDFLKKKLFFLKKKIFFNFFHFFSYFHFTRFYKLNEFIKNSRNLYKKLVSTKIIPIVYVKSTLHNVFVYLIYSGKIFFKKSCGELKGVRKKKRRFFRNVYPLANLFLKKFFRLKKRFGFDRVGFILNGDNSCIRAVWNVFNSYSIRQRLEDRKKMKKLYFYMRKLWSLKSRFKRDFFFQSRQYQKLCYLFHNIKKKTNFRILYVRDKTSWPFNGCRSKNRLC